MYFLPPEELISKKMTISFMEVFGFHGVTGSDRKVVGEFVLSS